MWIRLLTHRYQQNDYILQGTAHPEFISVVDLYSFNLHHPIQVLLGLRDMKFIRHTDLRLIIPCFAPRKTGLNFLISIAKDSRV